MWQQVIDLSVPAENGVAADPPGYEMSIENMGHNGIIHQWVRRYKGLNPARLPNGEAVALEQVRFSTRNAGRCAFVALRVNDAKNACRPLAWLFCREGTLAFRRFLNTYAALAIGVEGVSARIKRRPQPFARALISRSTSPAFL
jgi:hypothetical protein